MATATKLTQILKPKSLMTSKSAIFNQKINKHTNMNTNKKMLSTLDIHQKEKHKIESLEASQLSILDSPPQRKDRRRFNSVGTNLEKSGEEEESQEEIENEKVIENFLNIHEEYKEDKEEIKQRDLNSIRKLNMWDKEHATTRIETGNKKSQKQFSKDMESLNWVSSMKENLSKLNFKGPNKQLEYFEKKNEKGIIFYNKF